MALETLDIVAVLPSGMHRAALELSDRLADRMRDQGCPSHFRLGEPFGRGVAEPCAPHVSVFMLAVDTAEIGDVVDATRRLAAELPAVDAEGERYQHNPVGAPELYFRKTEAWVEVQRAVVAAVEPLRRGRLRTLDPAGERIESVIDDPRADPVRREQLVRFGYDEITEHWRAEGGGARDRFNPHVTLAWPRNPAFRVDLAGLPPAREFSGTLSALAVYSMNAHGTCTTLRGMAPFGGLGSGNTTTGIRAHSSATAGAE